MNDAQPILQEQEASVASAPSTEIPEPTQTGRSDVALFDSTISLVGAARATISVTWIYNRDTKESHVALVMVDLVPDEVPLIDLYEDWDKRLGNDSRWRAYSQVREVSSADALKWYNTLVHEGTWAPPWRPPFTAPTPLSDTLNEPRWPSTVTLDEARSVPFAAQRGGGCRLHHLLSSAPALPLNADELGCLETEVEKRLHADLSKAPELWQSAHFFQPMPFIRYVSSRRDPADGTSEEGILIDVVPRKGTALNSLTVDILEKRPTGMRLLSRFRPTSPFHRVQLAEDAEEMCIRVYHDQVGMLVEEGPFAFFRSAHISVNVMTHERRVPVPERKGRPAQVKRIHMSGMDQTVIAGSEPGRSAAQVLRKIHNRRKSQSADADQQTWFDDDVPAAEEAIQSILSRAKRVAMIVDPYFAADEIKVWLPSVTTRGAVVQVLTSAYGLRQRKLSADDRSKSAEREKAHLEQLVQGLETARAERWVNATEVRVMPGTPFHDRFVVADDRVWLLGSSLNQFGSRGTMLVALPSPDKILPELEHAWDHEAVTLQKRLEHLAKNEGDE